MLPLLTRTSLVIVLAALTACGSDSGPNLTRPAPQDNATDVAFSNGATMASNGEIAAAQLALTHSTNADVLAFANQMIVDHTAEKKALAPIAATLGITLPTTIPPAQVPIAQQLAALTGAPFDKLYIDSEITGHVANIDTNYDPELASGLDASVVTYAKTYLPQVQMHLTMAQNIKTKDAF